MGLSALRWFCFAFLSVSPLSFAAIKQTGIQYPSHIQVIKPTDPPFKFSDSRNWNIVSEQRAAGRVNLPSTFVRNGVSPGRLFGTALRASPYAFAALGVGSVALERLGYTYVDGQGFVKFTPTDPADPASWGSAPEGVTYSGGGVYNSDDLYSVAQVVVNNGIGCKNGECTLVGVSNFSPNCLEELRTNCSLKPVALKNSLPHSQGYFGQISVSNTNSNQISCASGSSYDPERFGCVSLSEGEAVSDEEVQAAIETLDYSDFPSADITQDLNDLILQNLLDSADFNFEIDSLTDSQANAQIHVDTVPSTDVVLDLKTHTDISTGSVTVTETTVEIEADSVFDNATKTVTTTTTETITETVYRDGNKVSETTTTNKIPGVPPLEVPSPDSGQGSQSGDWPAFCDWFPTLCEWLNWTTGDGGVPPDDDSDGSELFDGLDLQEIDLSDFETVDMSLEGSSVCPEPIVINIAFFDKSFEISYQPLCDLMEYVKLFVIGVSYLLAASIVLGSRR